MAVVGVSESVMAPTFIFCTSGLVPDGMSSACGDVLQCVLSCSLSETSRLVINGASVSSSK